MVLLIGGLFLAAYYGWLFLLVRIAFKEGGNNMPRLAYLRGDGVEIALAEEHLPGMKDVAKVLGQAQRIRSGYGWRRVKGAVRICPATPRPKHVNPLA
jgi:hypothetical protein